ncbi:MAG: primosomal protein N' [Planctomycetes bacterium]|nr:primosomal protein N' [Planctomycetota bacterium]
MRSLFDKGDQPAARPSGRAVGVAVNVNLWRNFDYCWPEGLGQPQVGQRVHVPFGKANRMTLGFVAELDRQVQGASRDRLKLVGELIDSQSLLDGQLWQLGAWMSRYYLTPLGMTLAAMIPSAVGRHATKEEVVVFLSAERKDWPAGLGGRQKRVLDELLEARKQGIEPLTLEELLHHSGAGRDTIGRLEARGLVRQKRRAVSLPELGQQGHSDPFKLNEEQQAALRAVSQKIDAGGFTVSLIHGVTGSGKTEIYIRAIRQVVAAGRQAILLVPEIALATQTLSRLVQRLPRVAVLHSGLTGAQRAFYYQQIHDGLASVVVGPRSAVFAPAGKLGLIVVDEEHEPGYKQDSAPRYHGRDVAIMRGSIGGLPVLLGSATPSLESYHNAQAGKYAMIRIAHRVRGLPMPKLQIVHLRHEMQPGRVELIGKTLTFKIASTLDRREQVILLMNRRGYASHVFCPKCRWIMGCESCTRSMVFHQATQLAVCHHCDRTALLPDCCPACKGKLLLFGYGIQRIEGELSRKFPTARVARMDSDTMTSPAQFRQVFEAFSSGQVDILLGTQMVAKGLDFPRVSLVGVASADTSLEIPDFRAAERTFQLIVQVAGRAGRAELAGEVVVQTLHGEDPVIQFAASHDYESFAKYELPFRCSPGIPPLPPFGRLIRFLLRHERQDAADKAAQELAGRLKKILKGPDIVIEDAKPCGVLKVRDQFRFEVRVYCTRPGAVQQALAGRIGEISEKLQAELVIDADPINMM